MFCRGDALGDTLAALLFLCSYILDNCDGEVALLAERTTEFGKCFDTAVNGSVHTALCIGLGIGAFTATQHLVWLWCAAAAALVTVINSGIALANDIRSDYHSSRADIQRDGATASSAAVTPQPSGAKEVFLYVFRELAQADFCFLVVLFAGLDLLYVL